MNTTEYRLLVPVLALLAFAALWIAVTWLLSHLSGWVALARIYRAGNEAEGIPPCGWVWRVSAAVPADNFATC